MLRRRPLFRLELPDGFRLRDGLGSNPVEVQMSSSDSLPRLFMWFASLFVDVSVPVRQVKPSTLWHIPFSLGLGQGPWLELLSMKGARTGLLRLFWCGMSQLPFSRFFLWAPVGTSFKPGKGSFHLTILWFRLTGLSRVRPL